LYQLLLACRAGATVVIQSRMLLPVDVVKRLQHHRVTVLPVVPTLATMLFQAFQRFPFQVPSVRLITNTGATLNATHQDKLRCMFPTADIVSMYGLTECKRCTYLPPALLATKPDSVGIAIPDTEVWVVDDHGRAVGPNVVGEIVVRGATIMRGYWNDPEATSAKLRPGPTSGEACLYTGDLGVLDGDGCLYLRGRKDDCVKIRGAKVSPKLIEAVVAALPFVEEVLVLPIQPADLSDELALGCLVQARGDVQALRDAVVGAVRAALPANHVPRRVVCVASLPKSRNGKLDRDRSRALLACEGSV
jgi:acyl-CoA synthetase (AMP-forming)/AMP-acid ligase II